MRIQQALLTTGLVATLLAVMTLADQAANKDAPAASQPAASQPASRAAAWKATGRYRALTIDEERELLKAVKDHSADDHTRLTHLAKTDAKQYQSLMRHMWAWYAQWRNLPGHVQDAYWTMRQTKAQTARLLADIQADKDGHNRPTLIAQLRQVQEKEFDAGQVIYKQWNEEFKARIEHLQAEVESRKQSLEKMRAQTDDRQKNRDKHVDSKVSTLLKQVPSPASTSPTTRPAK